MPSLNGWLWHFLEDHVYAHDKPPPRVRTKPMEVLCVGPPRSATESLQQALLILGYDHTYHGWDIMFENPHNMQGWTRLARKKFFPPADNKGDCTISAEEFDELLGHAVAVTDAASSVFAAEMIKAYPQAKVVLNTRRDLDKWHQSAVNTLVGVNENWTFWCMTWWGKNVFWAWHVYERMLWRCFFRCPDGSLDSGIRRTGKWVYREHCAMIRGLVPEENLLEWTVEDGWEPLCQFLGKDIPDVEFPNTNSVAGFKGREEQAMGLWFGECFRNMGIVAVGLASIGIGVWKLRSR